MIMKGFGANKSIALLILTKKLCKLLSHKILDHKENLYIDFLSKVVYTKYSKH